MCLIVRYIAIIVIRVCMFNGIVDIKLSNGVGLVWSTEMVNVMNNNYLFMATQL